MKNEINIEFEENPIISERKVTLTIMKRDEVTLYELAKVIYEVSAEHNRTPDYAEVHFEETGETRTFWSNTTWCQNAITVLHDIAEQITISAL